MNNKMRNTKNKILCNIAKVNPVCETCQSKFIKGHSTKQFHSPEGLCCELHDMLYGWCKI